MSFSDLAVLFRDVMMQPIRRAIKSHRFKQLKNGKFIACSENDELGE